MFRFTAKVGIASGVVYYTVQQGVWKDSETTVALYEKAKKHACPYWKKAIAQLPFELPSLPPVNNVTELGKHYWNTGVKNTFRFLCNSPTHVKDLGVSAYDTLIEFTKSPEVPDNK